MNLKKKLRKFFAFARRDGGFTLVELIVVIAILGVLSGVAVPAYGGYVKKANMAADEALISEVKHALQLYYYTNPTANQDAYVVLVPEGSDSDADNAGTAAMDAVFGEGWKSAVHLKYGNWSGFDGMTAEVAAAVADSDYFGEDSSVTELLGNVQVVTNAAMGFVGDWLAGVGAYSEENFKSALNGTLNGNDETFTALAKNAGIYDGDGNFAAGVIDANGNVTEKAQQEISNLMVFSVSEELKNATPEEIQGLVTGQRYGKYSGAAEMAVKYAFIKAYSIKYDDPETLKKVDKALSELNGGTGNDVISALTAPFGDTESPTYGQFEEFVTSTLNGEPDSNMQALPAVFGGVSSVKDKYIGDLNQNNLFISEEVMNDLNAFVGTAKATAFLGDVPKNAVVVALNDGQVAATYEDKD